MKERRQTVPARAEPADGMNGFAAAGASGTAYVRKI